MKSLLIMFVMVALLNAQVLPHTPYFDRIAGLF